MLYQAVICALLLCIVIPNGLFHITNRRGGAGAPKRFRRALFGNVASFFAVLLLSTAFVFANTAFAADGSGIDPSGLAFIGAALSAGLGSLGAGIATGSAASAALGAISENEAVMGKALIFVALAEGIAIYGLIIAFMILNRV